ncbi:hypothetical protein HPB52_007445 [Rhipicephalus sanguineus]|uniref:Uncharacterized protein n=1 Tax=Rhipicephalus sanguineus TaxID=34632 RepID=A0A9D4PBW6_RHISA|nr:hypothetical protein HPB52_007445 [Rhipicephalus sanguineus]
MATCDVRSARPVEHSPSSITLALLAVSAALQLLLLDGASAVQEPQLPDEHARVVYRPEILSLRTGERRFYVPLRRKQGAFESVAGDAVSPPSNCTFEGPVYEQGGEAITVAPSRNRSGTVGVGSEDEERHVVHRVPSTSKLLTSWSKLSTRRRRATSSSGRAIELAVFVDAALSNSIPDESELRKLLLAMLEQNGPGTAGGEIGDYLDNFCKWQCSMNEQRAQQGIGRWDHAILLSGLNLRSVRILRAPPAYCVCDRVTF